MDHIGLERLVYTFKARRSNDCSAGEALAWLGSALHGWMRVQDDRATAARFELFLAVSREASLADVLKQTRQRFESTLTELFGLVGASRPRRTAIHVIAYVEGLLLLFQGDDSDITPGKLHEPRRPPHIQPPGLAPPSGPDAASVRSDSSTPCDLSSRHHCICSTPTRHPNRSGGGGGSAGPTAG